MTDCPLPPVAQSNPFWPLLRLRPWVGVGAAAALLVACGTTPPPPPAPVEDRGRSTLPPAPPPSAVRPVMPAAAPAPGAPASAASSATTPPTDPAQPGATARPVGATDPSGRPEYYTVKRGDTLIGIGLETGQNWRDIARWNQLDNPNLIEVGQVLRVVAPVAASPLGAPGTPTATAPGAAPGLIASPAPLPPATTTLPSPAPAPSTAGASSAPAPAPAPAPATPPAVAAGDERPHFIWPVAGGPVLAGFDEAKNKGLDIGGKPGDPVMAAADGRVVYAGAGLRGYGNLVILKHNNTYLTAYAHNRTLLVKEDQTVRQGQKIAEMGNTDSDRVKLHFEIRRQGKPVDPSRFLPGR